MQAVPVSGARRPLLIGAILAVLALAVLPATSGATMPGANGRIAFEKSHEISESETVLDLWSVNPDGSGAMQLTSGKDSFDAAYSPDGSRLAFGRYNEILVAAADGSGAHAIALGSEHKTTSTRWVANYEDPETHTVYPWVKIEETREDRDTREQPTFAPDGSSLAVVHYTGTFVIAYICSVNANKSTSCNGNYTEIEIECDDCGSSIETIDAATGAPLAVLVPRTTGVYLNAPTFSHGGALAFNRDTDSGEGSEIAVVPAPGAMPIVIAKGEVREPDFSPDGTQIVFTLGRHGIGIAPAAGGAPRIVSAPPPLAEDTAYTTRSPIWSPDGALIAFGDIGGHSGGLGRYTDGGVYLMHSDGSSLTQIQGDATVPTSWQPIPIPPPSAPPIPAHAIKGKKKLRLNKKGIAVVAKVVCGSSPCTLKATKSKLKVGKKLYGVKTMTAKTLPAGATGQLKIKVKGKALAALKAKHHGLLALTISLADATGTQNLAFKPKVLPPARRHKQKR